MAKSDYPAGAYYDDKAPWNENEEEEKTEQELQDEYESFKEDMNERR